MAPEAPGNLIVIDSRFRDEELRGLSERLEYPPEEATQIEAAGGWFYVLWNERPPGTEYIPLGNGVVYVDAKQLPSGYKPVAKSPNRVRLDRRRPICVPISGAWGRTDVRPDLTGGLYACRSSANAQEREDFQEEEVGGLLEA